MLAHLAGYDRVAASTQHGAWNALVFLCRAVLKHKFPELGEIEHAKRPQRVPVACSREDVAGVWAHRNGVPQRMASVLSGAGLRVMAWVRLRVQDVDCASHQTTVHDGKGAHDRVSMWLRSGEPGLQRQLERGTLLHEADWLEGCGTVY